MGQGSLTMRLVCVYRASSGAADRCRHGAFLLGYLVRRAARLARDRRRRRPDHDRRLPTPLPLTHIGAPDHATRQTSSRIPLGQNSATFYRPARRPGAGAADVCRRTADRRTRHRQTEPAANPPAAARVARRRHRARSRRYGTLPGTRADARDMCCSACSSPPASARSTHFRPVTARRSWRPTSSARAATCGTPSAWA